MSDLERRSQIEIAIDNFMRRDPITRRGFMRRVGFGEGAAQLRNECRVERVVDVRSIERQARDDVRRAVSRARDGSDRVSRVRVVADARQPRARH